MNWTLSKSVVLVTVPRVRIPPLPPIFIESLQTLVQNGKMRVATFNLKHGAFAESYRGHPKQVKMIATEFEDVDILALQEVDRGALRSGFRDLSSILANKAGMKGVFVPTRIRPTGIYGNALLVRGEIENVQRLKLGSGPRFRLRPFGHPLPPFGHEPRNAILATARVGDRRISVAATHLSTERDLRKKQLNKVLGELACWSEPRILMGDFNQTADDVLTELLDCPMELVDAPPTYSSLNPKRAIDHIAVKGLEIAHVQTKQLPISDHLALFATVY